MKQMLLSDHWRARFVWRAERCRARRLGIGMRKSKLPRWNPFQSWLHREIRRHMLNLRQGAEPCFGRTMSREGKRRIFRVDPAEQSSAFFGSRT